MGMGLRAEIEVYFDERQPPILCRSADEVDAALDDLQQRYAGKATPLAVAIGILGHEVDVGIGADPTFLMLQMAPCDGEYYLAVGDESRSGEATRFYGAGQDSYWEPKNLVPAEIARAAVRHFIEHQQRSPRVRWQDWGGRDV
jgi:hypothetical protein